MAFRPNRRTFQTHLPLAFVTHKVYAVIAQKSPPAYNAAKRVAANGILAVLAYKPRSLVKAVFTARLAKESLLHPLV